MLTVTEPCVPLVPGAVLVPVLDVRVVEPGAGVPLLGGGAAAPRVPVEVRPRVALPPLPYAPAPQTVAAPIWAPPPCTVPEPLICSCGGWVNWPSVEVFEVVDDA